MARYIGGLAVVALGWTLHTLKDREPPCVSGAWCIKVDVSGAPAEDGQYLAQCSGRFPDYVDVVPESYSGTRFVLSQDYPTSLPSSELMPWSIYEFRTSEGADGYMLAVREYVYEGMRESDWRLEGNSVRRWYHVPWMTLGRHPREFIRGLTEERQLSGPELGLRPGVTVQNWAIGFYNETGGYAIGQVWQEEDAPNPSASRSPVSTVVAKVLFSSARPEDFLGSDLLAGAPEWQANVFKGPESSEKQIQTLRLMQIGVTPLSWTVDDLDSRRGLTPLFKVHRRLVPES